jgi:hypothetical protein
LGPGELDQCDCNGLPRTVSIAVPIVLNTFELE